MNLKQYFAKNKGTGVLATSGAGGKVDAAIYARPIVNGKNSVSFIMKARRSRRNLKTNPNAAYLFTEKGSLKSGVRLYLKMTGEDSNQEKVVAVRRRSKPLKKGEKLYLVHFKVTRARALSGDKTYTLK